MNEDFEITPLKSDLEALFFFGSEKQKYQVSIVIYYMMLLLKYDLIKIKEWRMQIINDKKYYSIKEIINELNERFRFNFKKDNATFQRFYRRKYPFIWGKSKESDF